MEKENFSPGYKMVQMLTAAQIGEYGGGGAMWLDMHKIVNTLQIGLSHTLFKWGQNGLFLPRCNAKILHVI